MSNTEKLLQQILENQVLMQSQIDTNHKEVINRLDKLEGNQNAIKTFIIESDDTFRKSEEAYDVITKFKKIFSN